MRPDGDDRKTGRVCSERYQLGLCLASGVVTTGPIRVGRTGRCPDQRPPTVRDRWRRNLHEPVDSSFSGRIDDVLRSADVGFFEL
jgi:hypothetical protein